MIKMRRFFEGLDSKRSVIFTAVAFTAGLALLYIIVPDIRLLSDVRKEKVLHADNISVTGFEDGKKNWEISSKRLSANRGQDIIEFEDVDKGNVFKKGRLIIKDLRAKRVIVTNYNSRIEAFSSTAEPQPLEASIDVAHASTTEVLKEPSKGFTKVLASYLWYSSPQKRSNADDVRVFDRKYTATTGHIDINHKKNIGTMTSGPHIKAGDYTIGATTMESYFRQDTLKAYNKVRVRVKKKAVMTDIKSDDLSFSTKDYSGLMNGHVELTQKSKIASSDALSFDDVEQTATLIKNVRAFIKKGGHILKERTVLKIRNTEAKKIMSEGVLLNCDSLKVSTRNGNATADGKVFVIQKGKNAKADHAFYDDNKETITMTGNVHIEKEGEWIKTKKVIVYVNKETFEAFGDVETLFKLKK
ncbi:MAG: hypothetical protein NTZ10_02190 [Candidatus Saganbacteria bacterium]|nr:hypothetical protein [Candidatus Saganbacteria bacterium]